MTKQTNYSEKQRSPDNSADIFYIQTRQRIRTPIAPAFNHLLVDGAIVSEEKARAKFQATADEINLKGQVVGQFITQSLMLAEILGEKFLAAQSHTQENVADSAMRQIQMQQQSGGIIKMKRGERVALRNRQRKEQQEQLNKARLNM